MTKKKHVKGITTSSAEAGEQESMKKKKPVKTIKTSSAEAGEQQRMSKRTTRSSAETSEAERIVKKRKTKKSDPKVADGKSVIVQRSKKDEDVLIKSKKEVKVVVRRQRFIVKCKPVKLCNLISLLNDGQKQSIRNVGFGGLLYMKEWKYVGWKNIMWFIEKFNPCSRVLSFENGHNLVLTAADVEDLFLLPRPREEGCDVLSYDRNDTVGFQFVEEFKNRLGLGAVPTHKSVFRLITNANDVRFNNGGEDFVILFILCALSTCLAPTSNTTLELNLLRTLKDVRDIHKFDWCLFVLKKLCKALESYKRGHYNVLNGCLLILPLLYCHHFKWQGKRLPFTLPLIRHWTSKKFNTRFKEESLGETVFGRGEWVVGVFPISEQNDEEAVAHVGENEQDRECRNRNDQDRQARNRNEQQTESDRRNEAEVRPRDEDVSGSRQLITYILPEGEKSDMCIDAISKNDLQKSFLILKRDFNVIVAKHIDRVQEIKKSSPKTVEAEIAPEPSCPKANEPEIAPEPSSHETGEPENAPSPSPPPPPPPSQAPYEFDMFSMDFWTDEVLREVEDIVSNFTAVNKEKILKNDYPRFNEIPSCSQPREEQEQVGEGLKNLHVCDTVILSTDIMKGKQNVEEEKKNLQVDSSLDGSPIYLGLSDRMNEHDSGIENVEVIGKQDAEVNINVDKILQKLERPMKFFYEIPSFKLWSQTSSLGDDEAEKEKGDCLEKQTEVEDPKNKEKVKSIEKCSGDQFKSPGVQISEDVTVHYS